MESAHAILAHYSANTSSISKCNLFVCGEAYSHSQGWVEGALNTAEVTLAKYFNLKRPKWLPVDYDIGP